MAITKVSRGLLSTGVSDSSDATAITIDSSERVGIGITDPDQALEIGAGGKLKLSRPDNARSMLLFTDNNNATIQSSNDPILIESANFMAFNTNGANERIRIDTSGNVGIATSSPDAPLHINGSANSEQVIITGNNNANRGLSIQTAASGGQQDAGVVFDAQDTESGGNPYHAFQTAGSEKMRINSDGDVIIGGTSAGAAGALSIQPDEDDNAPVLTINRASTTNTSDPIRFKNGGSTVSQISYNNSTVTYGTGSDARLKNILGEAKGLEIVNKLNPVNFEWKDGGEIQDGLIAQEVEELIPYAVNVNEEGYYSMDYSKVVTPLIKAIQEQQEQINTLQSEINILKGE